MRADDSHQKIVGKNWGSNQINLIITLQGGESHCNCSLWQFTHQHKTIKTYSNNPINIPSTLPKVFSSINPNLKIYIKHLPQNNKLFHQIKKICNFVQ